MRDGEVTGPDGARPASRRPRANGHDEPTQCREHLRRGGCAASWLAGTRAWRRRSRPVWVGEGDMAGAWAGHRARWYHTSIPEDAAAYKRRNGGGFRHRTPSARPGVYLDRQRN